MRARNALCAAALALAVATAPATAQYVVNLRDADIRAFIQDASRVTGRTFIIDQAVQGRVSVFTERPLSRSEYFEIFLSTLRANGLVAVPAGGGALRIQPAAGAAGSPGPVGAAQRGGSAFATEVIQLRSLDARAALETVRPLVGQGGTVSASRQGNALVVADYADNIRRIRAVLARLDGAGGDGQRVVPLRNAGAREIADALQALAGRGEGALPVSIVAVDSANAVALRGDAGAVARLAETARDLDARASAGGEIRVIRLRHVEAGLIVPVLQQLVGQAAPQAPTTTAQRGRAASERRQSAFNRTPGLATAEAAAAEAGPPVVTPNAPAGGAVAAAATRGPVIARFEGANAIVISAPADLQRQLGEVVRQLDQRRAQVLVEAIIVEISDTAARRLGVQFLLGGLPGSGLPFAVTNYSNSVPSLLTIAGAIGARELDTSVTTIGNGNTVTSNQQSPASQALQNAAVASILAATGGIGGFAANIGRDGIFGTIINAVRSDTESNILSTPSVMTLDNQDARILVGQEIPITTGQQLSPTFDNAFRTVERQNVGIQLDVRPQINDGGAIQLFIRQEVSSIAGPVSSRNDDLILNKREIETTVTVDDGEIVALGGLLDDNERRTLERIPLLSDIPLLGELFKSRSRSRVKTNLMVFIRPTILRSTEDARAVAGQRYDYTRRMQQAIRPDREPTIDELVRDYLNATPPPAPPPQSGAVTVIQPGVSSTVIRPVQGSTVTVAPAAGTAPATVTVQPGRGPATTVTATPGQPVTVRPETGATTTTPPPGPPGSSVSTTPPR